MKRGFACSITILLMVPACFEDPGSSESSSESTASATSTETSSTTSQTTGAASSTTSGATSTGGAEPEPPVLLRPADDAILPPVRILLEWEAPPEVESPLFDLYVGKDGLPDSPTVAGLEATRLVIAPETQAESGLALESNTAYQWRVALSNAPQGELSSLTGSFATDDSVIAWWRFDDDPLQPCGADPMLTICDSSGHSFHGQVAGGNPVWLDEDAQLLGRAIQLDGEDDYLVIPDAPALNPRSLSVGSRFQVLSASGEVSLIDKRHVSGYGYNVRISSSSFPWRLAWVLTGDGEWNDYVFSTGLSIQPVWHTTTCSYDDMQGLLRATVDAETPVEDVIQVALPRTMPTAAGIYIGRLPYGESNWLEGAVDDIILYNRPLSETEVQNAHDAITRLVE